MAERRDYGVHIGGAADRGGAEQAVREAERAQQEINQANKALQTARRHLETSSKFAYRTSLNTLAIFTGARMIGDDLQDITSGEGGIPDLLTTLTSTFIILYRIIEMKEQMLKRQQELALLAAQGVAIQQRQRFMLMPIPPRIVAPAMAGLAFSGIAAQFYEANRKAELRRQRRLKAEGKTIDISKIRWGNT